MPAGFLKLLKQIPLCNKEQLDKKLAEFQDHRVEVRNFYAIKSTTLDHLASSGSILLL